MTAVQGDNFDYVICGSTAFARLLAGLLAGGHGKRVCLIGDRWSPYRLPRRFDVSVTPATRPETWALLRREIPEALKLLSSIGRGSYERVDPLFVAETPGTAAMLGHMRWMALGFGFAAERAVDRAITETGSICRIRDAAMLVPGKAEPAIDAWLAKAGARWTAPDEATLTLRRDGGASIETATWRADAATAVLADDDAILERLPPADRHRLLTVGSGLGAMIEPIGPMSAAHVTYLDREVSVHQRAARAPLEVLATGEPNTATARMAASLPAREPLRRSGQCVFRTVTTADGAPLVGRMGRSRATVVAGLGAAAAFLAPAVARLLSGAGADEEKSYFAAREPARSSARRADVSEAAAATEVGMAS